MPEEESAQPDRAVADVAAWRQLEEHCESNPRCPRWLVASLPALGRLAPELIALRDVPDDARFAMIYPH